MPGIEFDKAVVAGHPLVVRQRRGASNGLVLVAPDGQRRRRDFELIGTLHAAAERGAVPVQCRGHRAWSRENRQIFLHLFGRTGGPHAL